MQKFIKAQTNMLLSKEIMDMGYQRIGMYVLECMVIEGWYYGQNTDAAGVMAVLSRSQGSHKILDILKNDKLFNIDSNGVITVVHGSDRFLAYAQAQTGAQADARADARASARIKMNASEEEKRRKINKKSSWLRGR